MNIILNGKKEEIPENSVLIELIKRKKLNPDNIIIQVNEDIVKVQNYRNYILSKNSKVEILSIVGGG